jgi:Flp pilus assembly protein TadD
MRRLCIKFCCFVLIMLVAGCQKTVKPTVVAEPNPVTQPVLDPQQLVVFDAAIAALAAGQLDDAEKKLKSLAQDPAKYSGVQTNLGVIAMRRGEVEQAQSYLDEATKLNPRNKHAWLFAGELAMLKHDYDGANAAYQKALALDEADLTAHFNLGVINDLYLMDYSVAERHYERYLALVGNLEDSNAKQVQIWLKLLERK